MFLAHVSDHAVRAPVGIGAVLAGLVTSRPYRSFVKRAIFVSPLTDEIRRLLKRDRDDLVIRPAQEMKDRTAAVGLAQISRTYNVEFLYGTRKYPGVDGGVDNQAEVLLVDVEKMPAETIKAVKVRLQRDLGVRFDKLRLSPEQERFVRLAVPAYDGLLTLRRSKDGPCVMISHDWYGLPLGLWIVTNRDPRFRTMLYAHEVEPVRTLIEKQGGRDVAFYGAMRAAMAEGRPLSDVFDLPASGFAAAMLMQSHRLGRAMAVGDGVRDELAFLDAGFAGVQPSLAYPGLPVSRVSFEAKMESRRRVQEYARRLLDNKPDLIFSHVGPASAAHAYWRDLHLLAALDARLAAEGQRAVLFILASAAGERTAADVARMEKRHHWPVEHHKGSPDLVGYEERIAREVKTFNRRAKAVRAVFINQTGWDPKLFGSAMPRTMLADDLRRGSDVALCLAAYEPFGGSALPALSAGAICAFSGACGCRGLLERIDPNHEVPTILTADFAPPAGLAADDAAAISARELTEIEQPVIDRLAERLHAALPRSEKDYKRYLALGYRHAKLMIWELTARDWFLPPVRETLS